MRSEKSIINGLVLCKNITKIILFIAFSQNARITILFTTILFTSRLRASKKELSSCPYSMHIKGPDSGSVLQSGVRPVRTGQESSVAVPYQAIVRVRISIWSWHYLQRVTKRGTVVKILKIMTKITGSYYFTSFEHVKCCGT